MRCVIPTKDNPPPEMSSWLLQFQVSNLFLSNLFLVNFIVTRNVDRIRENI